VKKAKCIIEAFLKPLKLELSGEKTRIAHTMFSYEGEKPGLDFLGYHFRNYACSENRGVKSTRGKNQKFRQISRPSNKAREQHLSKLRLVLKKHQAAPLKSVINALSMVIQGWTNYFAITKCTRYFSYMDMRLWKLLWRWSVKRYKSAERAIRKCWSISGWKFGAVIEGKQYVLKRHDETKVRRYIKIRPGASIYDGQILYFSERLSKHNQRFARLRGVLKAQEYRCSVCGLALKPTDVIEMHHITPTSKGGGNNADNLSFVHGHCHDELHKKQREG
jgi:RNA-directed DNA polymerase